MSLNGVSLFSGIPAKDASSIPDPYVKLYLLPGRSKETKRKTIVNKDNCNPVYDATFEYILSAPDLQSTELEVTVATQKGILSGGSPIIGIVSLFPPILILFHSSAIYILFHQIFITNPAGQIGSWRSRNLTKWHNSLARSLAGKQIRLGFGF